MGRSCVLVSLHGKCIMFDCGMHMGYSDDRRFPDFSLLGANLTSLIDLVVISHFHLDHCGALPYFTEQCGYDGPVIMTAPTRDIAPLLLEDYRKIMVERKGEQGFFTSAMISDCMSKVKILNLNETSVFGDISVTAFYAGHVLGAGMFLVEVNGQSVLYTGDYNTTADRHLGGARLPHALRPDLLITESTYATTVRPTTKRYREQDLLRNIHACVAKGGKVLIPTFALGRAQELCMLVDAYWSRNADLSQNVPVFMSAGLAEKATEIYQRHLDWTNESTQRSARLNHQNPFDFKHIRPWEKHFLNSAGPMVLFSTPGMLHSGQSLEVFRFWAEDPKNLLIIPGYCVAGTVGAKVLAGHTSIVLDLPIPKTISVRCQVKNLSFSAHADSKGIFQVIHQTQPQAVMLVHGEPAKMSLLKKEILGKYPNVQVLHPANGSLVKVKTIDTLCSSEVANEEWRREMIHEAAKVVFQLEKVEQEERIRLLKMSAQAQFDPSKYPHAAQADDSVIYSSQHGVSNLPPLKELQLQLIQALHPWMPVKLVDNVIGICQNEVLITMNDSSVTLQWKGYLELSVMPVVMRIISPFILKNT